MLKENYAPIHILESIKIQKKRNQKTVFWFFFKVS